MSVPDVSGAAIANLEVETLQHKRPTFHGDTIYAETRVLDAKESSSKPDRGIVTVETKGFNQHGEEVCYFRRSVWCGSATHAAGATRPYDGQDVWAESERRPAGARRGFGARRPRRALRAGPPVVPGRRRGAPRRRARPRSRATGARPRRRHRQAHPPAGPARGRGGRGRAAWPRCASQLAAALPGVEALDGIGRGHARCADASVDAVTVAQAFHWFDAPAALGEIGARAASRRRARADVERARRHRSVGGRARAGSCTGRRTGPTSRAPTGPRWWPRRCASRRCARATVHLRPGARRRLLVDRVASTQLHRGDGDAAAGRRCSTRSAPWWPASREPVRAARTQRRHWCHRSSSTPS